MDTHFGRLQTAALPTAAATTGRGKGLTTIRTLGRLLRTRRVTSRDVTEECLARIDEQNDRYRAFTSVAATEAIDTAALADSELSRGHDRGPLHGVPISLKDLIDTAGVRTSAASRVTEGNVAIRDAAVVDRLRRGGAVLIGKTNLHEFAFGTTSDDSAFGAARNPIDPSRSPGGSSGGSAISVALGMAYGSIGTDTGGSVRIPAAACGIVGLKPQYGELPVDGVIPLAATLDHVGVLAASVYDAFLLYAGLREPRGPRQLVATSLVDVRFGVLNHYFCDVLERGVSEQFDTVLRVLSSARGKVLERRVEGTGLISSTFVNLQAPEAFAFHAPTLRRTPELFTPNVRARIERGASIAASAYVEARQTQAALTQAVEKLFSDVDVLVLPTLPIVAPPIGAESVRIDGRDELVRGLMLKMTQLFNITGHPAISIPCGVTPEGLPVGLQLVAPLGRTIGLLEIAFGCERALERIRTSEAS